MTCSLSKREQNKARKRAEIVQIATRSFFDYGYAATSMSSISEELGGSKATLWAHFSSKEELLAAVMDEHIDAFARDVEEVLVSQTFSLPAVRRACLRFLDCLLQEKSVLLFTLVLTEGQRFPEISRMFYLRGPEKLRARLAEFYATRFPKAQAERLMRVTIAAITGIRTDILLRTANPTAAERETLIDEIIDVVIRPAARQAGLD
jgi:Transcriptional regulator